MKEKFYDINKLPKDGYIVFPLSMSRLSNGQSPEELNKMLEYFENKIITMGIDVVLLYTNGLYFNSDDNAINIRKKTNGQMLSHKNAFLKLILKERKYFPQAIHFLPWDYVILNSPKFQEYYEKLIKLKNKDLQFKKLVIDGLKGREPTEANLNFVIEELVVTHLIRQNLIEFPKTLVKEDKFRLVVYPGSYLKADLYQWKNKVLPQQKEKNINPYYASQYNFTEKIIYDFDKME